MAPHRQIVPMTDPELNVLYYISYLKPIGEGECVPEMGEGMHVQKRRS